MSATAGTDIDWTMLAAIGIKETGFQNKLQNGGAGVGVFQIDLGKNPNVTVQQASDLTWAANWAVSTLTGNELGIGNALPGSLSPDQLQWMLAASWNTGAQGQINRYNKGQSPDYHTSPHGDGTFGNNYGTNILELMDCFR
jgi:membrane-bound lytic murein transglycosylase MltF